MSRIFALSAATRPQVLAALVSGMGLLIAVIAMFTPRGSHAATSALGIVGIVAMLALVTGMGVLIGQAVSHRSGGGS
ncbi:hypothetical protein Ga0074812_104269 [Parafrankia irregularis]|uniref:Uncharacterized protein n=1 Tax=Parafrankia irregularis TaxID=795642 RepID=A0A0S4QII9_9ACTN|nr:MULTISPECIES: hypothetical protein [Parafrankia]MBE3203939.1 hypothetical protein [Parafrankia sp. CH37]CUU55188.1 hypothetical protein Ga0074812_104269 [Parafrankia irregularis]